ncbi:MAG: signal recognition particle-docking protein FtsY [Myxococcales bacterium]|nr:signal recognition particle-docking protein FtsY [Myxococcales bacterium]
MESLQLDLNNPTTIAAIAAVVGLILLGILIGFVRGRKKHALSEEPPPTPTPEAIEGQHPKIRVDEPGKPQPESTLPLQIEDLLTGPHEAPAAPAPVREGRVTPPPAPPADLGAFRAGLESTRGNLISRLAGVFRRGRELDTSILDEVEEVLITADVGVHTTERVLEALRTQMNGGQLSSADDAWAAIRDEARSILATSGKGLSLGAAPTVILVVGVNGVGKTTTIGKLASRFDRQGKSLLLAAGDTFRAAAVTQLEVWGRRVGCEVIKGKDRADPGSVIFDAIQTAKDRGIDLVIADTAGRLHTKVPLMDELKKLGRTVEKALGRPADHVLLVLDATTGQNAIQQAQLFKEALPVSGIVLTKLDGTAKGGVILGIVDQHQVPIEFIGVGEKVEDLKPFATEAFVEALFESPEALEPAEEAQNLA